MLNSNKMHTATDFSKKTADHIKRLHESKQPGVFTVNGKAALVIQDAETYEKWLN